MTEIQRRTSLNNSTCRTGELPLIENEIWMVVRGPRHPYLSLDWLAIIISCQFEHWHATAQTHIPGVSFPVRGGKPRRTSSSVAISNDRLSRISVRVGGLVRCSLLTPVLNARFPGQSEWHLGCKRGFLACLEQAPPSLGHNRTVSKFLHPQVWIQTSYPGWTWWMRDAMLDWHGIWWSKWRKPFRNRSKTKKITDIYKCGYVIFTITWEKDARWQLQKHLFSFILACRTIVIRLVWRIDHPICQHLLCDLHSLPVHHCEIPVIMPYFGYDGPCNV